MTRNEKSRAVLELPKVLELLAKEAVSQQAKDLCLQLVPEDSLRACEESQQHTADAMRLIGLQGSPSFHGLQDVSAALDRAEKGGFLNPAELLRVAAMLKAARSTRAYRDEQKDAATVLDQYFDGLAGNKYLEDKIETAILSEEEISDHASSELYQIRRQKF